MRKLNTKASFTLVIVLLLTPILLLGWLFVEQSDKDIAFARKELAGLDYVNTLFPLLSDVKDDSKGWDAKVANFLAKRKKFDSVMGTESESENIAAMLAGTIDEPELVDALNALISRIGDQSNLILDPDLDSYYLMDAAILRAPRILKELDDLAASLEHHVTEHDDDEATTVPQILAIERLRESLKTFQASISAAMQANSKNTIDPGLFDDVQGTIDLVSGLLQTKPWQQIAISTYDINHSVAHTFEVEPVKKRISAAYNSISGSLHSLLAARIERFETKLKFALTLCGIVALLALALSFSVFRSILNSLDDTIVFLAGHDVMTQLKNRASFSSSFTENVVAAKKHDANFAIHIIDIDGFKSINDSLGHQSGDDILKIVAQKLLEISTPYDSVARFGGDEFVVIQANVNRNSDAEAFAQRIVQFLHFPLEHADAGSLLSASVGTAVFGSHGEDEAQLLRRADIALYHSKMRGKNRATLFCVEMEEEHERRLAVEQEVRRATENKTFTLAYQPQFDVKANQVTGFEALLRLTAENGEPISPTVFIPVIEKLGLICDVGSWVLKRACETALHWPDNIQVAVNLSPLQFTTGYAVEAIEDAIRLSGLPPKRLQIEITESTLLDRSELILRDLNRIKALGVSIAMDDFGTGYSSLSYLWKFPFDKIKVDRSFVTNIGPQQSDARTLLHTIISLGHSLSMTVTVEGVETAEQARAMSELECDQVQGYHYGKPIPEPGLPSFLLQNLIHNMVPDLTESTGENLLASSEVDRLNLLH